MIIQGFTNPQNSLYFIGGMIIKALKDISNDEVDFFDLFERTQKYCHCSFSLFSLATDWLFLVGALDLNSNGKLTKCF